ncbi:MAG: hypothetical protein NT090_22565 [Acidobacteria bacterium]|nr:hypothetical protein [Acidobacteriota bacterium]
MTFEEAGSRYAQLRDQFQAGQLDFASFQAATAQLTVVDPDGTWWQIEPAGGEWVMWNGSAWVRPAQPEAGAPSPPPQRQYSLTVQTQDYRTQLKSDGADFLWVYASVSCTDPGVDCAALAGAVRFHTGGANPQWLALGSPVPVAGAMAVPVSAAAPDPATRPLPGGASVVAAATFEGQAVSAETTLEIVAQAPPAYEVTPVFWGFEKDSRTRSEKRAYRGQEFSEYELVADGEDQIHVALVFVRKDLVQDGANPAGYAGQAADFMLLRKAELTGEGSAEFELSSALEAPGLYRIDVKSRRPLLASEANRQLNVALAIEGEASADAANQVRERAIAARIPLQHKLLFLNLIVTPGTCQGTSEAWAWVGAAPGAGKPLKEVPCQIDLVSLGGGPWLELRGDAAKRTNEYGVANWTFDYRGLNWKTLGEARFKVRAGINAPGGPPLEATWVEIDVNANRQKFLSDLTASAGQLELNNPSLGPRGGIFDQLWPDSLSGPLNDIRALADPSGAWRRYSCGEMRDRIWSFALERRYSNDLAVASAMNGIDFGKYEIAPNHVCCGLFPAGKDDPYFIDPWWDQAFHPDKVLLTRAQEAARLRACAALLPAVGPAVLLKIGAFATAAAAMAAIGNWLARPLAGEQWLNGKGAYKETPSRWGGSFFEGPEREAMKTGTVSPLENW